MRDDPQKLDINFGILFPHIMGVNLNNGVEKSNIYRVFVNNDYVGDRDISKGDIYGVNDYLNEHGFHDFSSELEGNEYKIETQGDSQTREIKDILNHYLHG